MGGQTFRTAVALSLIQLAALSNGCGAQAPDSTATADTTDVLMTVSGGVSMGSYQGGFTWALVSHMRRDPTLRLRGVGGASAGNINSLLSVLEYCRGGETLPRESLFWKLWIQTGIDDLMPPFDPVLERKRRQAVEATYRAFGGDTMASARVWDDRYDGIFSRDFFHARHLELLAGLLETEDWSRCEGRSIPVGITLTSLTPRRIPLDREDRLWAATIRVASGYVVRFDERVGFGQLPKAMREARGIGVLVALPSDTAGVVSTPDVFKLTEASSAFPIAFAPRALRFYHPETLLGEKGACPQSAGGTCTVPEREHFIDGGVFDNNPVDLIWSLTHPDAGPVEPRTRLVYIDPDNYRLPLAGRAAAAQESVPTGGIEALLKLAESAVPAARQYELQSLQRVIQRYEPDIGDALTITDRALPIYGDHVGAFAAFFGKPFRMHDFYAGVYDALHFVASELVCGETDPADQRRCVVDRLRGEIEGQFGFPMDPAGQQLMRSMFVAELGDGVRPPARVVSASPEDSVLLDLLHQNLNLLDPVRPDCQGRAPLHRAICESGLEQAVEGLSASTRDRVRAWGEDASCQGDDGFLPPACLAEPSFIRLLDDPGGFAERLTEDVLERIRLVEDVRNREGVANQELAVELAQMAYRSSADRYKRYRLELDPSTIPDRDRTPAAQVLHHIIPYYFMGALGDDGNEFGWRPRFHLGPPWALDGLIGIHTWTGWAPRLAVGLGPSYKATPWATLNLAAIRTSSPRFWRRDDQLGLEASVRLLTDKLSLTVRWLPANASSMFEGEDVGFLVGLSDVNGLLYMIGSALD